MFLNLCLVLLSSLVFWARSVACTLFCKLSHWLYFLVSANTVLLICFLLFFFPFLFFPSLSFTFLYWYMIFWHSPGWPSDPPASASWAPWSQLHYQSWASLYFEKSVWAIPSSYPQFLWILCSVISPFDQTWAHLGFMALHIPDHAFLILPCVSALLIWWGGDSSGTESRVTQTVWGYSAIWPSLSP